MVETFGGKIGLFGLGFSGSVVPFKTIKEVGGVRKARQELKQLRVLPTGYNVIVTCALHTEVHEEMEWLTQQKYNVELVMTKNLYGFMGRKYFRINTNPIILTPNTGMNPYP